MKKQSRNLLKIYAIAHQEDIDIMITSEKSLWGYAAEQTFSQELKASKLKQIKFDPKHLIQVAKASTVGNEKLAKALPYLLSEYGKSMGNKFKIDWQDVPSQVILDYVYGIDSAFTFRGWNLAIDVTTNPENVIYKINRIQKLKPLWAKIGIDYFAVAFVNSNNKDRQPIVESLRSVIKGEKFITL